MSTIAQSRPRRSAKPVKRFVDEHYSTDEELGSDDYDDMAMNTDDETEEARRVKEIEEAERAESDGIVVGDDSSEISYQTGADEEDDDESEALFSEEEEEVSESFSESHSYSPVDSEDVEEMSVEEDDAEEVPIVSKPKAKAAPKPKAKAAPKSKPKPKPEAKAAASKPSKAKSILEAYSQAVDGVVDSMDAEYSYEYEYEEDEDEQEPMQHYGQDVQYDDDSATYRRAVAKVTKKVQESELGSDSDLLI